MERISEHFTDNVRWFDETLGAGRSCDMVCRDLVVGGRRGRIWVIDGFGGDAILERMGSFWLSLKPEQVGILTQMQEFTDRFVTFMEVEVSFDREDIVTSVLLGKSLLLLEGVQGAALIDAKEYPSRGWRSLWTARCCEAPTTVSSRRWCPTWPCCAAGSGTPISPWRV